LHSSVVRAKSVSVTVPISGNESNVDAVSGRRSVGHERRGTGGASEDEIRSSMEDRSSSRSSHQGRVSSAHDGIGAELGDWRDLRDRRPLDSLGR
jgi:hypothetical protein